MSQPMALLSSDLSEPERRLIVAALRGEPVDMGGASVRGTVLAELVAAARPGWVLPRGGLELARVVVTGGLDLAGSAPPVPLTLLEAVIEPGADGVAFIIRDARLLRLTLQATHILGAVVADRAEVTSHVLIGDCVIDGPLQARSARIGGTLAIERSHIGDGEISMFAAGLAVEGPLVLRASRCSGAVVLTRARLDGGLNAEAASIACEGRPALDLGSLRSAGDIVLSRCDVGGGGVMLEGASIDGLLTACGASVGSGGIDAHGATITRSVLLADAHLAGPLSVAGARIGAGLAARGIEVHGGAISIDARLARIGGGVDLGSAKLVGTVEAAAVEIAGSLDLQHARLYGAACALDAAAARIGGDVLLQRAVVQGRAGLAGADVTGRVSLTAATIRCDDGEAFDMTAARVGAALAIDGGATIAGRVALDRLHGEDTELLLTGSRLSSLASARGAAQTRSAMVDAVALSLAGARLARIVMPDRAEDRPRGIIDLSRSHAGEYVDFAAAWPPPVSTADATGRPALAEHLVLDGFTCGRLANPGGETAAPASAGGARVCGAERVAWLEAQAPAAVAQRFHPQPWAHMAERLAAQGCTDGARAVTLAAHRRRRRCATAGTAERWLGRADDLLTRHGQSPWRPLVALVVVAMMFAGLFGWAAGHCTTGAPCSGGAAFVTTVASLEVGGTQLAFHPLGYSVDALLPFVDLGYTRAWTENPTWHPRAIASGSSSAPAVRGGQLLRLARVAETLLGLALLLLLVSGVWRSRR